MLPATLTVAGGCRPGLRVRVRLACQVLFPSAVAAVAGRAGRRAADQVGGHRSVPEEPASPPVAAAAAVGRASWGGAVAPKAARAVAAALKVAAAAW